MPDRVARNTVHASCNIHLLDAIDAAKLLRADLAGRGFLIGAHGGEGKNAPRAHSEHTADDALLPHTQADHRVLVALGLKDHHRYVVRERGGGSDDLVIVGRDRQHLFQRLLERASGAKIVKGENQARTGAQAGHCFGLAAYPALKFQVQELTSGSGGLAKNFQLRRQRALEVAAIFRAAAGPDGSHVLMVFEEAPDLGQSGGRLLQVVQAEFDQGVVSRHDFCGTEQVVGGLVRKRKANFG